MNNDLRIIISGILDTSNKAIDNINNQLKLLQSKINGLSIDIKIDDKVINNLNNLSSEFNKIKSTTDNVGKSINESLNIKNNNASREFKNVESSINKVTKASKEYADLQQRILEIQESTGNKISNFTMEATKDTNNLTKATITYKDELQRTRQEIYRMTQFTDNGDGTLTPLGSNAWELEKTRYVDNIEQQTKADQKKIDQRMKLEQNYEQWWLKSLKNREITEEKEQQKLADQIANVREQSAERTRIAEQKLAEVQAQASNKNLEQTKKEEQQQEELNKKIQREIDLYQKSKQIQVDDLKRRYGDHIDTNALNNQLSKVTNIDPKSITSIQQLRDAQKDIDLGFREIQSSAKTSSSHVLSFGEAFKTAMIKFPIWMAASTAFFQSLAFLRDGISYVNELNKSLTQIAIVTGQSQQQVSALGEEYNKLAYEMGVLTNNIADASVEFYRQGLTQEEVMNRVSVATQYAKISNIEFAKASEILTATVNSMNIPIERASDVFSYLGDATATGADEIGQAMQRVGGSAGAMQLEFEKVASWIAVLSARTREGSGTIGNSIKSLLARIQNMTETGFDEMDGTSINQVAKALASVDIALMDSNGQFRNFGTVMDELGGKWKTLDSRQKAYLSTTVAGTYQQSKFLNLMEGYQDTIPLYEKSLLSAGQTQQKFNIYLESNEAAINRLITTWQGLWQSSFDSGAIRVGIESLDLLAKSIKYIVDNFGLLAPTMGLATTGLLLFNNGLRTTTMTNGTLLISFLKGASTGFTTLDSAIAGATLKTRIFNGVTNTATASMNGLKTATIATSRFLAGAFLPMAIVMGASLAIGKLTENLVKAKQEAEELKQQQDSMIDAYSKQGNEINKLVSEYENLTNIRNSKGLNVEQEQRYVDLQNELGKVLPSVVKGVDAKGNSILESSDRIREQISVLEELITLEKEKARLDAPKKLEEGYSRIEELKQEAEYQRKVIKDYEDGKRVMEDNGRSRSEILAVEQKIAEWKIKQKTTQVQINEEARKNAENFKPFLNGMDIDKETIDKVTLLLSTMNLAGKNQGEIEGIVLSIVSAVKEYNNAIQDGNDNKINKSKQSLSNLLDVYSKGKITINEFTDAIKEGINATGHSTNKSSYSIEELTSKYEDLAKEVSPLNQLLETMAEGKSISADEAMNLISKEEGLIDAITIENGQVKVNTELVKIMRDEKIKAYTATLEAEKQSLENQAKITLEKLGLYNSELGVIKSLAQAKLALLEMESEDVIGSLIISDSRRKLDEISESIDNVNKLMKTAGKGLTQVGTSQEKLSDTKDKSNKKDKESIYITDEYKNAMASLNLELERLNKLKSKYPEHSNEYRKAVEKEIALTKEQIKLNTSYQKDLQKQLSTGKIKPTGMVDKEKVSTQTKQAINNVVGKIDGINQTFLERLNKLGQDYGKKIEITSGYRSIAKQQELWNKSDKSGKTVAKPGSSAHNYQIAADVGGWLKSLSNDELAKYGLYKPMGYENWHVEPIETKSNGRGKDAFAKVNELLKGKSGSYTSTGYTQAEYAQSLDQLSESFRDATQEGYNLQEQLDQLNLAYVNAKNAQFDYNKSYDESYISNLQKQRERLNDTSQEYIDSVADENKHLTYQQSIIKKQIAYNQEKIKSDEFSASAKDELKSKIIELNLAYTDLTNSIIENNNAMNDSKYNAINDHIDDLDFEIQQQEILKDSQTEGSNEYIKSTKEINRITQDKINLIQQQIDLTTEDLALQKVNSARAKELRERLEDLTIAQMELQKTQRENLSNIADDIIQIYKDTYEKQKEVAVDAIDEEMDALEKSHDRKIELLDEEYSKIEEVINAKLKSMQLEKESNDYNKQLTELQKQQQKIDKEINSRKLDNSMESQAKVVQLEEEKQSVLDQIAELQASREYDLREQNLNDQLDAYKKDFDKKKESEDDKFNTEKDSLDKRKKEQEKHYDNLINDERKYASIREQIMQGNVDNLKTQLDSFGQYIQDNMSTIGESISQNLIDKLDEANRMLSNVTGVTIPTSNSSNTSSKGSTQSSNLPSGWTGSLEGSIFKKDGSISYGVDKNGYIYKNGNFVPVDNYKYIPQEVIDMAKKRKLKEYHIGGVIDDKPNKFTDIANKLFNLKPNETVIKALKGELMIPQQNIANNFVPNMQKLMSSISSPQLAGIPTGDTNYNLTLEIASFNGTKQEAKSTATTIIDTLKRWGK